MREDQHNSSSTTNLIHCAGIGPEKQPMAPAYNCRGLAMIACNSKLSLLVFALPVIYIVS
jgi:hypothetical protein